MLTSALIMIANSMVSLACGQHDVCMPLGQCDNYFGLVGY